MEEKLIEFSTAKLAKEKGFHLNTPKAYIYRYQEHQSKDYVANLTNNPLHCDICAPTQSLLQKWIREVHNISIKIDDFYTNGKLRFDFSVSELGSQDDNPKGIFEDYEEALEMALFEALKLIK